jgi:hypothetical protein
MLSGEPAAAAAMPNDDDDSTLSPAEQMKRRAQRLAGALVDAARAPDSAEFLAEEEAHERRQAAIIAAYHAVRKRPDEPPGTALADIAALRDHLHGQGLATAARADGLRVVEPAIDIEWMREHQQVRFTAHPGFAVPATRKAEVAAVVAKANALSQLQVWRTEPELTAEYIAALEGGTLWTRDADRAIRILKTTLARDADELREAAGE